MFKKILLLAISCGLAIIAVFVQQGFTSDSPVKANIKLNDTEYSIKLPVVNEGNQECLIEIPVSQNDITGSIYYKIANANDDWKTASFIPMNDKLVSVLPYHKPNVKLEYFITLTSYGVTYKIPVEKPVIIRFQGSVPKIIYYPYVVFLFIALIFACYAGCLSAYNFKPIKKYVQLTFYFLLAGVVLGLVVHLLSFRHLLLQLSKYNDLTFYKYLIIFLLWLGVYYINKKKEYRFVILPVSLLTVILYCIPQHLLFGFFQY